jgi:hypothetical protein
VSVQDYAKIRIGNSPLLKVYHGQALVWELSGAPAAVASDLMLWYDLNEAAGNTFTDKSTRNRHATFTNPQWTTGGAVFTGTGYAQLPATAFPTTLYGFTLAIRFKGPPPPSPVALLSICSEGQPPLLEVLIKPNGTLIMSHLGIPQSYTYINPRTLVYDDQTWNELVIKSNSGRTLTYLDGVLIGDNYYQVSPIMPPNTDPLTIGGRHQQVSGFFQGTVDEVRFFNDARAVDTLPTIFTADPTLPYVERTPVYANHYYGTDWWEQEWWDSGYGLWPGGTLSSYTGKGMGTFGQPPGTDSGSEMRLIGEGFEGLTGVTLNGNSLPFQVLSRESVSVDVLGQRSGYFSLHTKAGPLSSNIPVSLLYTPVVTAGNVSPLEWFPGTIVTITGTYLAELTQVRTVEVSRPLTEAWSGDRVTKLAVRSRSETQLTCEIIQIGTSGVGNACRIVFEDSAYYYGVEENVPSPYPIVSVWAGVLTISNVSPATLDTYDALTLTGSGFTNAGTLSFNIGGVDMSGSTVIVDSDTQLRLFPNKAASGTVQLTSTLKKGITSTGSVSVTVTPPVTLVPVSDVVVNAWTIAPLWSKLNDLTDTTFIDSGFSGPLCTLRIETGSVAGKKPVTAELRIRMAKAGNQNNQLPLIQVLSADSGSQHLNHGTTTVSTTTYTEYIIPFTGSNLTVPTAYNLQITSEQQKGNSSRFSSLRVARAELRLTF